MPEAYKLARASGAEIAKNDGSNASPLQMEVGKENGVSLKVSAVPSDSGQMCIVSGRNLSFARENGSTPEGEFIVSNGESFRVFSDVAGSTELVVSPIATYPRNARAPRGIKVPVKVIVGLNTIKFSKDKLQVQRGDSASVGLDLKFSQEDSDRKVVFGFANGLSTEADEVEFSEQPAESETDIASIKYEKPTFTITGKKHGSGRLFATVTDGEGNPDKNRAVSVVIEVVPATQRIIFEPLLSKVVLGQTVTTRVRLLTETGETVSGVPLKISLPNQPDGVSVRVDPESERGDRILITGKEAGEAIVTVSVSYGDFKPVVEQFVMDVVPILDFSKIKVSLTPQDDSVVRNTFGIPVAKDYHVLQVHVLNDLTQLEDGRPLDSILLYGSSLDTGVILQKRKEDADKNAVWEEVTEADLEREYPRAKENPANAVSLDFREFILAPESGQETAAFQKMIVPVVEVGSVGRLKVKGGESPKFSVEPAREGSPFTGEISLGERDGTILGLKPGLVRIRADYSVKRDKVMESRTSWFQVRVVVSSGTVVAAAWDKPATRVDAAVGQGLQLMLPKSDNKVEVRLFPTGMAILEPDANIVHIGRAGLVTVVISSTDKDGKPLTASVEVMAHDRSVNGLPPSTYINSDGKIMQVHTRMRYRPVTTELMLLAHNAREFQTSESALRRAAQTALQLVTLGTSLNMLTGRGADLANAGATFLLPLINVWTPDMSEAHRAALLTQGMRALEELPKGAELVRYVFFPKKELRGVIPGYVVRIASIDTTEYHVPVGIVQKAGSKETEKGSGQ